MSETKYTPGPWTYYSGTHSVRRENLRNGQSATTAICCVCGPQRRDDPRVSANAHLIAASPDYDHAARALVARHDALASAYDGTTRCECQDCALFRPIIAKADGR